MENIKENKQQFKLVNGKLYEEQLKKKMWEIWYNEDYQYYFGGDWRFDFSLADSEWGQKHSFAVLNSKDELIGYIGYCVDNEMRVAHRFGAINFSDEKLTFGRAMYQVIMNCFFKFGMEVVEWCVICGNPIEKTYDRLCKKFGGNIIGIRHRRAKNLAGETCDDKIYEILRENFLNAINYNIKPKDKNSCIKYPLATNVTKGRVVVTKNIYDIGIVDETINNRPSVIYSRYTWDDSYRFAPQEGSQYNVFGVEWYDTGINMSWDEWVNLSSKTTAEEFHNYWRERLKAKWD